MRCREASCYEITPSGVFPRSLHSGIIENYVNTLKRGFETKKKRDDPTWYNLVSLWLVVIHALGMEMRKTLQALE